MPYPEGHKIKVRNRIIESAARAFRSNGIRDISVPVIMKGAGLTHGGFYSHFESKDQLVAETCGYAIGETIALLEKAVKEGNHASKIEAVIESYLNPVHRDHAELGCMLPAVSGEISRSSEEVREAYSRELERVIAYVSELGDLDRSTGTALFSLMLGTLVLARSVQDVELSDSILASGRQHAKSLATNKTAPHPS